MAVNTGECPHRRKDFMWFYRWTLRIVLRRIGTIQDLLKVIKKSAEIVMTHNEKWMFKILTFTGYIEGKRSRRETVSKLHGNIEKWVANVKRGSKRWRIS